MIDIGRRPYGLRYYSTQIGYIANDLRTFSERYWQTFRKC